MLGMDMVQGLFHFLETNGMNGTRIVVVVVSHTRCQLSNDS
jgi:hypothetical protein